MTHFIETLIGAAIIGGLLGFFYILFVVGPVSMYTEIQCLRQGYPKYAVTINLERYCLNLEGTVTVKVKPQ